MHRINDRRALAIIRELWTTRDSVARRRDVLLPARTPVHGTAQRAHRNPVHYPELPRAALLTPRPARTPPQQRQQAPHQKSRIAMNRSMYEITLAEHPELKIPYFGFRGVPVGIDVHKVVATGIAPVMDIGVAGVGGGQIGAGVLRAPLPCFTAAAAAHREAY